MVLEVIEQNEVAVKLYQKVGFHIVRRLVGFIRKNGEEKQIRSLEEIDLRQIGRLVSQYGLPDLPWQLSGESLAQMTPPARAYCLGKAYIAISDPDAERVIVWSLLVEDSSQLSTLGADLLRNVISHHTGKTWHVPAIFPEEFESVFIRAGFEREELTQWQMKTPL